MTFLKNISILKQKLNAIQCRCLRKIAKPMTPNNEVMVMDSVCTTVHSKIEASKDKKYLRAMQLVPLVIKILTTN